VQIEAGTISVVAGYQRPLDLQGVEPIDELNHPSAILQVPTNLPTRLVEIVLDGPGRLKTEEA
jgi:hypothetical protein